LVSLWLGWPGIAHRHVAQGGVEPWSATVRESQTGGSRTHGSLARLRNGGAEGNRAPDFGAAKATGRTVETTTYVPVATVVTIGLSVGEHGVIPGRCRELRHVGVRGFRQAVGTGSQLRPDPGPAAYRARTQLAARAAHSLGPGHVGGTHRVRQGHRGSTPYIPTGRERRNPHSLKVQRLPDLSGRPPASAEGVTGDEHGRSGGVDGNGEIH